jgi:hypothetical protein
MILTFEDELLTNTVSTPFPTGIASIFTALQLCLGGREWEGMLVVA